MGNSDTEGNVAVDDNAKSDQHSIYSAECSEIPKKQFSGLSARGSWSALDF